MILASTLVPSAIILWLDGRPRAAQRIFYHAVCFARLLKLHRRFALNRAGSVFSTEF
ncbi:MAG: hypothetical protein WKF71_19230 [Pyrinomonadaceae bacterium]